MLLLKLLFSLLILFAILVYVVNITLVAKVKPQNANTAAPYLQGRFRNHTPSTPRSLLDAVRLWIRFFTEKKVDTKPDIKIPVRPLRQQHLTSLSDNTIHIVKLGHSSVLLKVYGEYWLLDPVFSERASPFQFIGPQRFHTPPLSLAELPKLDKVLISHNHYDHLDKASIKLLAGKTEQFFVPIGVDGDLEKWGVPTSKIKTFDWWQEEPTSQGMVAFTPCQHFSGRGIGDSNSTLWGSWVIKTPQHSLYFSGDSGYFAGFKEIGEAYGPFDLTMIETGAYDKDWASIHMKPEESVQAHIDLKGKVMMPIHNGTFDLAFHTWHDPFDRVVAAAKQQGVDLTTPEFGQIFSINDPAKLQMWWTATINDKGETSGTST